MSKGSFKDYLNEANESWAEGKDKPPGVPDGSYQCKLIKAEVHKSKENRYSLKRTHLVLSGEYAGEEVVDFMGMQYEGWMFKMSQFIKSVGFEAPEDATELEDVFSKLEEAEICYNADIKCSKDSELRNVFIKDLIDGADIEEPEPKKKTAGKKPEATKPTGKKPAPKKKEESNLPEVGARVKFEAEIDGEDKEVIATVTSIDEDAGTISVEDEDANSFDLSAGEYELFTEDEPEETEEEETSEEDDTAERIAGLVSIFKSAGIKFPKNPTEKDMAKACANHKFIASEHTEEEIDLLKRISATIKVAPSKPTVKKKK